MKDLYGKKEKHDHKFSNILKGCILAIVMLAPFFAILSKMIYVSVNKNAKDSYYGETINEITYENITAINDEIVGKTLYFDVKSKIIAGNSFGSNDKYIYFDNLKIITTNYNYDFNSFIAISFYVGNNETDLNIWFLDNNQTRYGMNSSGVFIGTFEYTANDLTTTTKNRLVESNVLKEVKYNKYSYLDNVFYYAIEQSKDEEILNWTKNTPIYNVINTMNTGLGLSNNHILTYLLTYWSIILAIYIVFDIIIFIFTKITHYLQ